LPSAKQAEHNADDWEDETERRERTDRGHSCRENDPHEHVKERLEQKNDDINCRLKRGWYGC